MKRIMTITVAALTVITAGTAAVAAAMPNPATAAQIRHTLTLTVKPNGPQIDQGKYLAASDTDYQGKTLVGRDVISCVFAAVATCDVSIALKNGILLGHFIEKPDNSIHGKITGGSGRYRHATGTITSGRNGRTIISWST
jgi:hypothetical protein